jgi:hypothetical protein
MAIDLWSCNCCFQRIFTRSPGWNIYFSYFYDIGPGYDYVLGILQRKDKAEK